VRTIRAANKKFHTEVAKDHKNLTVLNFNRSSTSALGDGDLNFEPRLMTAPGGEDDLRRGKKIFHTEIAKITKI
jgi:hypothetical protein